MDSFSRVTFVRLLQGSMVRRGQPTLAYPANTPSGPRPLLGLESYAGGFLFIPVLAGLPLEITPLFRPHSLSKTRIAWVYAKVCEISLCPT